jgi:hypothetical protein
MWEYHNFAATYFAADTIGCCIDCRKNLIRKRGRELYMARGSVRNRSLGGWLQAAQEINHYLSA